VLILKNQEDLLKTLLIVLFIALTLTFSPPALAADTTNGAKIFSVQCVGCHVNGGNIVRRGKTLKKKALQRNGVESLEAIASLVANGKNNMPAYKDRLSAQQIENVSAYVLEQADQGWR
jgi:cytochrome c6